MKLPTLDTQTSLAPALEELLAETGRREPDPLRPWERGSEIVFSLLLVAASVALLTTGKGPDFRLWPAVALTVAYAVAHRARFYTGAGYTTPTQLVVIPMLFVVPFGAVPLCAALGTVLARLPDVLRGNSHPDRLFLAPANAWYALGPACVFAIADVRDPRWTEADVYAMAFVAQVLFDFAISTLREWLALGIPPSWQLSVLVRIYLIDALLTPVGFAVAFAAYDHPYAALLVLPLVAVFAIFAQEREANIETALQLSSAYRGTALLLGDVLEDKDAYTASHSHGVVALSLLVSDRLGLSPAAKRRVEFGALLHDIGKIAVPAEIINKAGPLDDHEWSVMKMHTVEGQQMLDRVGGVLADVGRVVRSSHEHWDGGGYPDGLQAYDIPIEARIVTACDAFSAMTTNRSYRAAMTIENAREELIRNSGTQFDPRVVEVLLEIIHDEHVRVSFLPAPSATAEYSRASASVFPPASS
jgi:HD-GYP domain-containing protein (c-di-GMP phosphodiesterase class II)